MKNMKRVISTLLMLSIMAAMLCVPAFAAGVLSVDLVEKNNVYEINENEGKTLFFSANFSLDPAADLSGVTVVWYKNDVVAKSGPITDATYTSASFGEGAFEIGTNKIKVEATGSGVSVYDEVSIIKHEASQTPSIEIQEKYVSVEAGKFVSLTPLFNPTWGAVDIHWHSSNPNVAEVEQDGTLTGKGKGDARITISDLNNTVVYGYCHVTVTDPAYTGSVVSISPIVYELNKNQTINISASVSGSGRFDHWYVADNMGSYVTIANTSIANTTLTARATTNVPVKLVAVSDDGASASIEFTIVATEPIRLEASPVNVSNGQKSTVYVVNAYGNEEFLWTVTPSAQYGVLTYSDAAYSNGNSINLTAGPLEGRVTVTATSKSDANRTATTTVYVNSEGAFGGALIKPTVATWQRGQAALKFEVYPAFFKAYMDGKLLTANSGYYTYYNGILTINTSLLSSLSSGEHVLKVYTSSNEGIDGMVYATIYVTGSASNVYGDNAHVRGSAYNLYFTSTDPIKEVYISNQWIDPANYSLTNNGTGLTLHSDFLNKLGYGSYSMRLATQNGYNQNASFRIVTANYAPATGDDANMGAWMALLILSLAGAVVLIPRRKKSTDLIG